MGLATSVAYPARLKTLSKALTSSENQVPRLADGQVAASARERKPRRSLIVSPWALLSALLRSSACRVPEPAEHRSSFAFAHNAAGSLYIP